MEPPFRKWLQSTGLSAYTDTFEAAGYRTCEEMRELTADDALCVAEEEMGMAPEDIATFLAAHATCGEGGAGGAGGAGGGEAAAEAEAAAAAEAATAADAGETPRFLRYGRMDAAGGMTLLSFLPGRAFARMSLVSSSWQSLVAARMAQSRVCRFDVWACRLEHSVGHRDLEDVGKVLKAEKGRVAGDRLSSRDAAGSERVAAARLEEALTNARLFQEERALGLQALEAARVAFVNGIPDAIAQCALEECVALGMEDEPVVRQLRSLWGADAESMQLQRTHRARDNESWASRAGFHADGDSAGPFAQRETTRDEGAGPLGLGGDGSYIGRSEDGEIVRMEWSGPGDGNRSAAAAAEPELEVGAGGGGVGGQGESGGGSRSPPRPAKPDGTRLPPGRQPGAPPGIAPPPGPPPRTTPPPPGAPPSAAPTPPRGAPPSAAPPRAPSGCCFNGT